MYSEKLGLILSTSAGRFLSAGVSQAAVSRGLFRGARLLAVLAYKRFSLNDAISHSLNAAYIIRCLGPQAFKQS